MAEFTSPYPYSLQEARERGELDAWRESLRVNVACKKAIESAIIRGFSGYQLASDCAMEVIEQFGLQRVTFVLANTLHEKDWDGRFSRTNREWFGRITVPPDKDHNYAFAVDSHPAVLDGFMDQFRQMQQKLSQQSSSTQVSGFIMQ